MTQRDTPVVLAPADAERIAEFERLLAAALRRILTGDVPAVAAAEAPAAADASEGSGGPA